MLRYSKAFTMIELIAIMVIVSILASSAITSYSSYNKWQDINEAVLDMVNTLRRARDYCMAANEKLYLTVAIGATDSYTLTYKDAKDALNISGESSNVFTMPSYVDFTESGESFTDLEFTILGEPASAKTITINSGERTINIVFPTGYIYAQ
tara:strand:- start:154 stop:609 length:456 start_codon:yes stop_codon:yes gene_type:complete